MIPRPKSGLSTLIIVALVLSLLFLYLEPSKTQKQEVPLSTFIENVKTGDVTNVNIEDNKIKFVLKDGKEFYAIKEPDRI